MQTDALWTLLGGLVSAVGAFLVARLTVRQSERSLSWERDRDLYARLDKLEEDRRDDAARWEAYRAEVAAERAVNHRLLGEAFGFIDRLGVWLADGLPGRHPRLPRGLREHVDYSLWEHPESGESPGSIIEPRRDA